MNKNERSQTERVQKRFRRFQYTVIIYNIMNMYIYIYTLYSLDSEVFSFSKVNMTNI